MTPPTRLSARDILFRGYGWSAAGAFVASLTYFAWFYLVRLNSPPAASGDTSGAIAIDVTLFTVFALHHSLLARAGAKRWLTTMIPAGLERATYVWISSALFFSVCFSWQTVPGTLYAVRGWAALPFLIAQAAGLWLIARASGRLEPLTFAGVRQASGIQSSDRLQMSGPYRIVRHPVYLGWTLFLLSTPIMTVDRALFAAISTVYLIIAIQFEERSLVETFAEQYRVYARRVRWRMIPGIY